MAWKTKGRHLTAAHKRAISRALLGKKRARRASRALNKDRKFVVRRTVHKATTAGARGAGRAVARGAFHGAKRLALPGVLIGAMVGIQHGGNRRAAIMYGAKAAGGMMAAGAALGVAQSHPLQAARRSSIASAQLSVANRKAALDRKAGLTRKQSMSQTYKGYNKAGSVIRTIKKVR